MAGRGASPPGWGASRTVGSPVAGGGHARDGAAGWPQGSCESGWTAWLARRYSRCAVHGLPRPRVSPRRTGPHLVRRRCSGGLVASELRRVEVPVRPDRREIVAAQLWALGAVGVWEQPGTTVAWFAEPAPDLPGTADTGLA